MRTSLDLRSEGAEAPTDRPSVAAILGTGVALAICAGVVALCALGGHAIPRPAQLALLIGALWVGFLGAGMAFQRSVWPPLAHIFLLATVMVFSADILLIARAYHIGGHYPDGFLLCSVAALALVALVPSEPVAIVGLLIAAAWTSAETFGFWAAVHLPFLIVWLGFMTVVLWRRWVVARHVGFLTIVYWCAISIVWRDLHLSVYLIGLYVPIAFAIAALSGLFDDGAAPSGFRASLLIYSVVLFLVALIGLGFRSVQYNAYVVGPGPRWIAAFLVLAAITAAVTLRCLKRRPGLSTVFGTLLALAILGGLTTLFFNRLEPFFESWGFKAALVAASAWIVMRGDVARRPALLNIGFVFLLVSIVRTYVDAELAFFEARHLLSSAIVVLVVTAVVLIVAQRKLRERWRESPEARS